MSDDYLREQRSVRRSVPDLVRQYPYQRNRPGIHMPRWASRIDLEVTGVSVERLQDITEEEAKAEGIVPGPSLPQTRDIILARELFAEKWDELHGAGSWDANPWVWVVRFKRAAPLETPW